MAFKITIPEPCHENWLTMTPTQKGAFCDKCEKEVIDFTAYSNYELARKLGRGEKLCGRFRAFQLNTTLPTLERSRWRESLAAVGFTALAGFGTAASAQEEKAKVCETQSSLVIKDWKASAEITATGEDAVPGSAPVVAGPMPEDAVAITGTVMDGEGIPLPGANVVVAGARLGAQTDFDGNFTLEVPEVYLEKPFKVSISYIGFETVIKTITSDAKHLEVQMQEDVMGMGEVIIVGRPNIFRRIGNLFRRNY